jgi:hypothetical protein
MQLSEPPKPKPTRKRLKKEILSDDFKKRKIFWKKYCGKCSGKFSVRENFPPHITRLTDQHVAEASTYTVKHNI